MRWTIENRSCIRKRGLLWWLMVLVNTKKNLARRCLRASRPAWARSLARSVYTRLVGPQVFEFNGFRFSSAPVGDSRCRYKQLATLKTHDTAAYEQHSTPARFQRFFQKDAKFQIAKQHRYRQDNNNNNNNIDERRGFHQRADSW
jgi:hypothetical protein